MKSAFDRYATFIKEYIFKKGWNDLKEVQVEACSEILDTDNNLIIASNTASGKTEAAFFPILTELEEDPSESIGVLYISPLKALINDQFDRINEILQTKDMEVFPWHGDINYTVKNKAFKEKKGIIQITPESLEALIMRNPGGARALFSDLRYIVIDEIHNLMESDRGLQVISLINRLDRLIKKSPRRIGLSATLSNYGSALDFISAGSKRGAKAIGLSGQDRTFQIGVQSFVLTGNKKADAVTFLDYFNFLYDQSTKRKTLIFTNSRNDSERIITNLKSIASERNESDIFHVHHGSLSNDIRKETESLLKESLGPTVAAATLTLELGIDIGDLDRIIQVGAPYSSSSFVQRLGRSGRRNGRSQMLFVDLFRKDYQNPISNFPWNLLRAIAIIELYSNYKWVEPLTVKEKPYSLLVHQTLSILYAFNGLSPAQLARQVLTLPPFKNISQSEYKKLLKHLINKEILEQLESGEIIIGIKGENIVNHYSFYSVFQTRDTYEVISDDGPVGSLDECPPLGSVFVLGGASWKVTSVNEDSRKVFVIKFPTKRLPERHGEFARVHERIMKKIKEILSSEKEYSYLQLSSREILEEARSSAKTLGVLEGLYIPTGKYSMIISPWTGTKQIQTIYNLLNTGLRDELKIAFVTDHNFFLEVTSLLPIEEVIEKLEKLSVNSNDPDLVLEDDNIPQMDKYDYLVPDELLKTAYLKNHMDIDKAVEILRNDDSYDLLVLKE